MSSDMTLGYIHGNTYIQYIVVVERLMLIGCFVFLMGACQAHCTPRTWREDSQSVILPLSQSDSQHASQPTSQSTSE